MDEQDSWQNTKSKTRNARNRKNKFKDKTRIANKNQPVAKKEFRPKLESNSYRYDSNPSDDNDDAVNNDTSRDFSLLSKSSLTPGHFQFKSDKLLFAENDFLTKNIFNIDIKLLKLSLNTIPFHTRHNIDEEYFIEEELQCMNTCALSNREEFDEYLLEKIEKLSAEKDDDVVSANEEDDCIGNVAKNDTPSKEDVTVPMQKVIIDKDQEELENFLDDILDD